MQTLTLDKGEALHVDCIWKDDAGTPLDLREATLSIREADPPVLAAMAITRTDDTGGAFSLSFPVTDSVLLGMGRVNWFRLEARFSADNNDVTPKIWIKVN